MAKHKIIAVVKFNNHEALVLEKYPELVYKKSVDYIIGSDGVFLNCYGYDRPGKNWKAFGGRKFDITLDDGTVEHCNGQWWDAVTPSAQKFIDDEIILVTANDIESLTNCFVFTGLRAIKSEYEKLRATYSGEVFEYDEYREKLYKELNK